jgi:hypothetical protein
MMNATRKRAQMWGTSSAQLPVDRDTGISTESGYEIDGETRLLCCMPGHVGSQHVGEQRCREVDGHAAKEEAIAGISALLSSAINAKGLTRKVSTLHSLLLCQ